MEILFKAKRVDNKDWIEGMPCEDFNENGIAPHIQTINETRDIISRIEVIPETVCQFTGLYINGERLFNGDLFEYTKPNANYDDGDLHNFMAEVVYDDSSARFMYMPIVGYSGQYDFTDVNECDLLDYCKIIGNSHDARKL